MNFLRRIDIFGEELKPFRLRSIDSDYSRFNTCCLKIKRAKSSSTYRQLYIDNYQTNIGGFVTLLIILFLGGLFWIKIQFMISRLPLSYFKLTSPATVIGINGIEFQVGLFDKQQGALLMNDQYVGKFGSF